MDLLRSVTPWDLGAISLARFGGTSLSNVLEQLELSGEAVELLFVGADQGETRTGHTVHHACSLPLEVALLPDTLLGWETNGGPLLAQHGYPLRLLVPGWYGMASAKWLKHISLLPEPFDGFFQRDEYVYVGEAGVLDGTHVTSMRVCALILKSARGSELLPGKIRSGHRLDWTRGAHQGGIEL